MPFPDDRDRSLILDAARIEAFSAELTDWASKFNPERKERRANPLSDEEEFELWDLRRKAERISISAAVPAAAAAFGPSQSGKSLLIGQILQPKDEEFSPLGRDDTLGEPSYFSKLSFTQDLNPQCGTNEATSLVTRFTTKDRLRADVPAHAPVMVLTLSRTDWLRVLARGFHAECRWSNDSPWDVGTIEGLLADLCRNPTNRSGLVDRNWRLDLVDAFEAMRQEDPRRFAASGAQFAGLLLRNPLSEVGYSELASRLFWDAWPGLTDLYKKVSDFIAKLAPVPSAGQAGAPPHRPAIFSHWAGVRFLLDSQRGSKQIKPGSFHPLFRELQWSEFRLVRESGWMILDHSPGHGGAPVELEILQACLLEMVIPVMPDRIKDDWRDVLHNVDLLDVPGMRAVRREGGNQGQRISADDPRERLEIVKRGKVLHLFDRYVDEYQMQTLLVLIRGGNLEVRGPIARAINRWGTARYGSEWGRVRSDNPALVIGLTGIDEEFRTRSEHAGEALYERRIEQLADTLGPLMRNFDGGNAAFDNILPVRYPGTLDASALQRAADGQERWEAAKRAFLGSAQIRRHVRDPERRWDAAMAEADGGLSLIASTILGSTSASVKQAQLRRELDALESRLRTMTQSWIQSQDVSEERERRKAVAKSLNDWLRHQDHYEERVRLLHQTLTVHEADLEPLADLEDIPSPRPETPAKRVRDALQKFLDRWLNEYVPNRWRQAVSSSYHHDAGVLNGLDDGAFLRFIGLLVDYLRSEAVFAELNRILVRVIFPDLQNEDAKKHARRRYTYMVLNDYIFNPGPSIPEWKPPTRGQEGSGPADWPFGLQQPFLDRWRGALGDKLAEGAGAASIIPPGNIELIELAARHGASVDAARRLSH